MNSDRHQIVYALLPDTGLGNKMLVWAKAFVFAKKQNLQLFQSPWWGFHWGAWFRYEKYKRVYLGYFKKNPFFTHFKFILFRLNALIVFEPIDLISSNKKRVYVFNKVVTSSDYFQSLKPFREEIRLELNSLILPKLLKDLEKYPSPVIGVHIRRGDFKLGSTITPESFFISSIIAIRNITGKDLAVEVFTDAFPQEIAMLLSLPNVYLAKPKPDILDILLLSRSKICILSIGSTFSFWAGFLSDGILLRHPNEWHPLVRPSDINKLYYEANFDPHQPIDNRLIDLITGIKFETEN